jgi:carboxymethylenebutenolidase
VNTTSNAITALTLAAAVAGLATAGYTYAKSLEAAMPATSAAPAAATAVTMHSVLPSAADAKPLLNWTTRHREWIVVPVSKDTSVLAWVVYPERSDRAQLVMVKGESLNPSAWTRAVSDQLSAEGYLTVVPDVLTEIDPSGNRRTRATLDSAEIGRREEAIRQAALKLPDADRSLGTVELVASPNQVRIATKQERKSFPLSATTWPTVIGYLNTRTGNAPIFEPNPHALHMAMMAQAAARGGAGNPGNIVTGDIGRKDPRVPANYFMAKATLRDTKLKSEWVDIPLEGSPVKLHTFVVYPAGTAKTGVVIVMQHGVGVDEWQRALAVQVAEDGFLAVLPDLWSGTGPNGGNWDASEFIDDAVRNAAGKVNADETMRRYKTAREWALKLPRANGKTGSIGFCAGGGNSFRFATEVADLNAAVVYYGGTPPEAALANIKAPVLGLYGENDGRMAENVMETKAIMDRLGKQYEPHLYPKTTHSFAMFQHIGTNAQSIADAWPRTIAFFKKNLSS